MASRGTRLHSQVKLLEGTTSELNFSSAHTYSWKKFGKHGNKTALASQLGRSSPACTAGAIESRKCIQIIRETNMPAYVMSAVNTCSNVTANAVMFDRVGKGGK